MSDSPQAAPESLDDTSPVTMGDYLATAGLAFSFVATILLSVLFARPFADAGLQAFEDPEEVGNSIGYIALLIAFTFLILYIAKKGKKWMIRTIILAAVTGTLVYVFPPLLVLIPGFPPAAAWGAGLAIGIGAAWALYKHPEWYVIDSVGILVAAGAASIFGISLGIVPVVVLLAALAVYDAIAVYKTKHMLALADSVMELRLPVLLVVPKGGGYRFREEVARFKEADEAEDPATGDRGALFMGLGDLVMPTILVVSAIMFAGPDWGSAPALGAALGTMIGFGFLMTTVLKGRPQAGLPLLNGGSIVGFLVGLYLATGSIVFW